MCELDEDDGWLTGDPQNFRPGSGENERLSFVAVAARDFSVD